jgi:hypothetical protein
LNPFDKFQDCLRDNKLADSVDQNCQHFAETSCKAWNGFTANRARIAFIASRDWAKVSRFAAVGVGR